LTHLPVDKRDGPSVGTVSGGRVALGCVRDEEEVLGSAISVLQRDRRVAERGKQTLPEALELWNLAEGALEKEGGRRPRLEALGCRLAPTE